VARLVPLAGAPSPLPRQSGAGTALAEEPASLPKALSVEETEQLLAAEPESKPQLLCDQAMFELMYSSGLRLAELVALDTGDGRLDLREGEVTVTGKGSKTRTVPVGARAREALRRWLEVRAQLASAQERRTIRRRARQAHRAARRQCAA
jgi:integrase/recombinase XerC